MASNGRLRARMPGDQSASRPGHTLLSRGNGEGGGAGLLWTSIPPGWVPSLVRGHSCPHLLCTSQQSHLFGDGFPDGCARGLPVRGGLTRREWQAMGDCGQGCPPTKVPRGLGTRCSLEAMGREGGGGRSMDIDSAGAGSIPGPRASLPASSLHIPAVSPVWRAAFGCVGFGSGCSGWPD